MDVIEYASRHPDGCLFWDFVARRRVSWIGRINSVLLLTFDANARQARFANVAGQAPFALQCQMGEMKQKARLT